MPLNLASFPEAETLGRGRWIIAAASASVVAVGRRTDSMLTFSMGANTRVYLYGPACFKSISGGATVQEVPDGLALMETGFLNAVRGTGGEEPPSMGS